MYLMNTMSEKLLVEIDEVLLSDRVAHLREEVIVKPRQVCRKLRVLEDIPHKLFGCVRRRFAFNQNHFAMSIGLFQL